MKKIFAIIILVFAIVMSASTKVHSADFRLTKGLVDELKLHYDSLKGYNKIKKEYIYSFEDKHIGYVFQIMNENTHKGYVVYLFEKGIVQVTITDTDVLEGIDGRIYYAVPSTFLDYESIPEKVITDEIRYSGTVNAFHIWNVEWNDNLGKLDTADSRFLTYDLDFGIPYIPSNVETTTSYYHTQTRVNNVPDFLNPDGFACVPTSTAMLMAYYDNEYRNSWTSFDGSGNYMLWATPSGPMNTPEEQLIEYFMDEMRSDGKSQYYLGVTAIEWSGALSDYFDDETLYPYYDAIVSAINDNEASTPNDFENYKTLIDMGNPAVLFINTGTGSPYTSDHAVIGIGHYVSYNMSPGVITYDNFVHGYTLIIDDYIDYFGFIYND